MIILCRIVAVLDIVWHWLAWTSPLGRALRAGERRSWAAREQPTRELMQLADEVGAAGAAEKLRGLADLEARRARGER